MVLKRVKLMPRLLRTRKVKHEKVTIMSWLSRNSPSITFPDGFASGVYSGNVLYHAVLKTIENKIVI